MEINLIEVLYIAGKCQKESSLALSLTQKDMRQPRSCFGLVQQVCQDNVTVGQRFVELTCLSFKTFNC